MATQATYDVLRWPEFLGEPKPALLVEGEVPLFTRQWSTSGYEVFSECDWGARKKAFSLSSSRFT